VNLSQHPSNNKSSIHALINSTIRTIVNQFYRKPDLFFNEHDFHHYCYHSFYRQKEFSKLYTTRDGKRTNILHPEYPTLKRFIRKVPKVDEKGLRARYDIAILNPEFIENNDFDKVRCRDIFRFDIPEDYIANNLIAALEFKFIIRHGPKFYHEIHYDHLKLSQAEEAESKYMLVFTNTIKDKIDYFKGIKLDRDIRIIFVAVYDEDGKKIKRENSFHILGDNHNLI